MASPLGCPLLDLQLLPFLLSLPFPFSFLLPCLLTYLLSCSFILFFFCCLETALHCCPGWSGNTVLTWPFHLCFLSEFVSVPCNRNWLNWLGWVLIPGSSNFPAAACFASFVLFCKTHSVLAKRLRGLRHLLLSLTILVGSLGTTRGRRKSALISSPLISTHALWHA